MESVRCYLCDHEFVEGEEPWLMFEQRLREDGKVECSLADLLSAILQKHLEESLAHSTLLCDSCNADVLEYESLEKRFSQIRERILNSYKENSTISNLNNSLQNTAFSNCTLPHPTVDGNNKLLVTDPEDIDDLTNSDYAGIMDIDLIEEVPDEEVDFEDHENINVDVDVENVLVNETIPAERKGCAFIENVSSAAMTDNFDFAAFNEHVAQNSLPSGVLNLSDGLVNLDVSEKNIQGKENIIIYDVNSDQVQETDLITQQDSCGDLQSYDSTEDDDLDFIISPDIFTSETNCDESQQSTTSNVMLSSGENQKDTEAEQKFKIPPKPVCMKEGEYFICLVCEISLQFERNELIKHFHTKHNAKFYMCEHCYEGFGKRQDLRIHSEIGHEIQCDSCERTFTSLRLYRAHKRTHLGNSKPFECTVCQKKYVSKAILEEHMNTHTGVRPFQCTECSKDFASKYTLYTHMKIHKDRPRPYKCDQCQKCFLNQQNLNQHKKLHVSVRAFECVVCHKAFATQHSLQVHKVVHSGQRPFLCRICGKSFARRPEIQDHERTHTGEKPFKCEFCPLAFAQRTNLATHRKSTHLNEKLHKCEICLRSFKRKRLLDYHIQAIHTGERPHKCEICGSGFVYPEHYKKHMLIHSGKKPYACEVCGKQFNSRDNRNAHRFVHSDKKPYECLECGAGFMRKPLLLTHMKQTKHISDTIIVNQPQFTQHPAGNSAASSNTQQINLQEEDSEVDVDNDLTTDDVCDEVMEKIFDTEDLLAENISISTYANKAVNNDEDVIPVVDENLIKGQLDDVKYLEYEELEREGHQVLTWVDIGGGVGRV